MTVKKTIVVTGSSSGMGRAMSERLLSEGHRVIGLSRSPDIFPNYPDYFPVVCDLSQLDRIEMTIKKIISNHQKIDILVSNAGAPAFGHLEQLSTEQICRHLDLNLTSHLLVTRYLLPVFKKQNQGTIILMGSESALEGGARGSIYSAAKFGLRGFAQSLRKECASNQIRVTLINPGMVKTPFFKNLNFAPGDDPDHAIAMDDVVGAVMMVLKASSATVFDEINLSPLKKVVVKKKHSNG